MRQILRFALLFTTMGLIPLGAQQAEYEVEVAGQTYSATDNQPFTITSPQGEQFEIVIRRKETVEYNDNGIAFRYYSDMTFSTENDVGVITLTLDASESPLALIQIYSVPTTPDLIRKSLVEAFRNEFKSRQAEFLEESGREKIIQFNGVDCRGTVLEFYLARQRMQTEIYAFAKGASVIAVVLQHDMEDQELAEKYFSEIAATLR
ncbi:MAG: hypothetical protein KDH97_08385 [Calditrichaeota bacterium]|nr:hypothetical protein [Calditrichota bacterium]MCB0290261.1 hypothetical protein [Calditrichota bacterium]MCB9090372.1 hypothetical protein [Calditrichia bacterium]